MNPRRRAWLLALAGAPLAPAGAATDDAGEADDTVRRGRVLRFPRDHGAHPGSRTEWWYLTGWLRAAGAAAPLGFQVTFFRSRTGLALGHPSRFAARQLLFAHAAVTDVAAARHRHDDRLARWSGADDVALRARAARTDTDVRIGHWQLRRHADDGRYTVTLPTRDWPLELVCRPSQPLLLQGDAGWSQKGPSPATPGDAWPASHYLSHPQLQVQGRWSIDGRAAEGVGRAWLDHEWSDELLHPAAVGWDWIGINLDDGSALTAFRLRRADGSTLWAGGSFRSAGGAPRIFDPADVRFEPGRRWRSPASHAEYPVDWTVHTPAGVHRVQALLDAQELDGRGSTGTVYWEGLSTLLDAQGRTLGMGYLEMTGYAGRLRL